MRRRVADIAIFVATALLGGLLFGCGLAKNQWSPTEATSEPEFFVIAETARFSGATTTQHVRGEISTTFYEVRCPDGSPCHAFGWYVGGYGRGSKGTAYYYQPDVNRSDHQGLSWAAAHEVCHSITGPAHNAAHATCNASLYAATPPASAALFRCLTRDERERGKEGKP